VCLFKMREQNGRVLVTGLTGFTGQHLELALMRAGYQVYGISHSGEPTGSNRYFAELNDRDSLVRVIEEVRPQYVIHLAAISFVAHEKVDDIYQTNIGGTRNLLSALAASSVASSLVTVLLASSANVYGSTEVEVIDESHPMRPANDYAVSKVAMEQMAALWKDRLPITIVRPFNYTGAGQSRKFLIPKVVEAFALRAPTLDLGNLDIYRDFSDVRDVVKAYERLLALSPRVTLNICSQRLYSLREIIDIVSKKTRHTLEVKVDPKLVRANEVRILRGNAAYLRSIMPEWHPRPIDETLAWMLGSIQNSGI
jgi:nucleoside-diphosphate-sugar epimerase